MYDRILIPSDGSACSEEAVRRGLNLAKALGSQVTFLAVVEDPSVAYAPEVAHYQPELYAAQKSAAAADLERLLQLAKAEGVDATTQLAEHERPADAIHVAEADHDLIIMGTHGRRGFNRLVFGSVAEAALRRSEKPYLMVRSPDDKEA